jgi:hypothetical protein
VPFWNRSRADDAMLAEAHRRSEVVAQMPGDLPCTEGGCERTTALACQYVDRRNRSCQSAWCPEHRLVIDGQIFCRRHAGVVSALPGAGTHRNLPLPDLENRAPSLVSWVARELDADIRRLLLAELPSNSGAQLITDPVYLVFVGADRQRAWERSWKLVDHTGHSLRVALIVEEDADAEIGVKIGSQIIDRLLPPWIVQRLHGAPPPPAVDAHRRDEFNRRIIESIRAGIAHERQFTGG